MKRPAIEPAHIRRQRREDGDEAVEQDRGLEHPLAAEPVGELALPGGADEDSEELVTVPIAPSLRRRRELRADHVRHQRAQDDEVDDVEEIARR